MPGYREITIPGEARHPRRPAAAPARAPASSDWRAVFANGLGATLALCRNSPGTVFGSLVALGAAGFVCVNALGHQSGRHPAPILPKTAAQTPPPQRMAAAEAPRETAKPASTASKPAGRDAIGELIRSDETTASVTPRAEKAAKGETKGETGAKADDAVLRAQRALSKLGYGPIKADGAMGPATRAAIETFERKAKLPVTGQAAGKTLRELVARAGQG